MLGSFGVLLCCVLLVQSAPTKEQITSSPSQINKSNQQSETAQVSPVSVEKGPTVESDDAFAESGFGGPEINWGFCPQLEPSNDEKIKKAAVITKCLEVTPIPVNITQESVEMHREQVAACALQMEGWFDDKGLYKYDKAESEIKAKKLQSDIEEKVLRYHTQCKDESIEKYPTDSKQLIAQIQLYQACMDYFISEVCGIEVAIPEDQFNATQFQ